MIGAVVVVEEVLFGEVSDVGGLSLVAVELAVAEVDGLDIGAAEFAVSDVTGLQLGADGIGLDLEAVELAVGAGRPVDEGVDTDTPGVGEENTKGETETDEDSLSLLDGGSWFKEEPPVSCSSL